VAHAAINNHSASGCGPHAVYARFLDPDRKLKYPEVVEKK